MQIDKENLEKMNLVTIEPERELESHEQILNLLQVREGNRYHVGFVIDASDSASKVTPTWIGAKVVEK